jgi:hypothetical protein
MTAGRWPAAERPEDDMSIETERTGLPTDAEERVRRAQAARDEERRTRATSALAKLHERYRAERSRLISPELARRLREYADTHRLPPDAKPSIEERARRRAAENAFAAEQGLDLAALNRLQDDFHRQGELLTAPTPAHDSEVSELPASERPRLARAAGFAGWWDPGYTLYTTRPNHTEVWNAESYFQTQYGRSGSHMRYRLRKSDDSDSVDMQWRNGFMVPYTPPVNGYLWIDLYLTHVFCNLFIDTDNAPGWSYAGVYAWQYGSAEIYWNWSDDEPADLRLSAQVAHVNTKKLEDWIDVWPVAAGYRQRVRLYSNVWFPAGHTLAVFGTTHQRLFAHVDDERVTSAVNAAAYVDEIRVGTY